MENFDDGKLIELVRQSPVVYNNKDANYKNKMHKENAWATIGTLMNAEVSECVSRWNAIRDRYGSIQRKIRNTPSGSGAPTISWPLYEECSFLDAVIVPRRTARNIKKVTIKDEMIDLPNFLKESMEEVNNIASSSSSRTPSRTSSATSIDHNYMAKSTGTYKRKKEDSDIVAAQQLTKVIAQSFENLVKHSKPQTPLELTNLNYSFGRTIALMLEDMDNEKQKEMRAKIMATLVGK